MTPCDERISPIGEWRPGAHRYPSYAGTVSDDLTPRDRAILAFEADWPRHSGAKEESIREALGLAPARYYQLLSRLIDSEAALAADPLLVRRLRRIRDERAAQQRARLTS